MGKDIWNNRDYAKQLIDFSGLQFGKKRPTDVDAMIEYGNKGFIFFELKYGAGKVPLGQDLALVRLTDSLDKVKPTLLVYCSHHTTCDKDVPLHETKVIKYRRNRKWYEPKREITAYDITVSFLDWLDERSEKWRGHE